MGISEQTFYTWKKRYAGLGVAELRKTRQLEDENRRLKQLVADLTLDNVMLQDVLAKKALKPAIKRERVHHLLERFAVTSRRACRQMLLGRSSWAYRSRAKDTTALRLRLRGAAIPSGSPSTTERSSTLGR